MNGFVTNPFVGLRPFETDESLLFFGRQKQIMDLLERLHQHQFVAITGSSGCGKSSLIRAGLIPKLKAGYLVDDRDGWIISVMKPGESPIFNLATAMLEQLKDIVPVISVDELQKRIRDHGMDNILELLNPLWDKNMNFFLLVDQFEEIFTGLDETKAEANDEVIDFVNILLELADQKELPVYVVITMRSDYIGDCSQFYGLPEALNQSQYIVPRLNRIQLKTVIEGPIKLSDGRIQQGLTERLLNDAQNVKVELPLLQHLLMRIWEREKIHQNGELDLEDYKNIGGIENALSNHADEALQALTPEQQRLAKKIFQSLTRIDEKGRKTRRRVHLKELALLTGKSTAEIQAVINKFNEDGRSFLIINKLENSDDLLIDISHESLIAQWRTLNAWVDEEAESANILLRLAESADLYSRDKKNLLSGNELHPISQWYNKSEPDPVWAKRYKVDFEKSIVYLKESEKEERRQKARIRRNRRLIFSSVVFVSLLILAFAIVIFVHNIKRKRELALNYWSSSQVTRDEHNYLGTLHFIAEAATLTDDKEFLRDLLIDGQAFLPRTYLTDIFPQHGIINSVSLDGNFIIVAGNDRNAYVLDRTTGEKIKSLKHNAPVNSAVLSPDGKSILTASNDSTSIVWDFASGDTIHLKHNTAVNHAVFGKDGKKILTAAADGYIRIYDLVSRKQLDSLPHRSTVQHAVIHAVFSADEKKILAAYSNGEVIIWDVTTKDTVTRLAHRDIVRSANFSPDNSKIVTACADGYARIWNAATGEQTDSLKHDEAVTGAMYSPDGKYILTSSRDKTACLWDSSGNKIGACMKDEGAIYSAAFSKDGKWIVTGGWDKTIRVWAVSAIPAANENKLSFSGLVNSAAFSPEGKKALIASDNHYAYILDVTTPGIIDSLKHASEVTHAAFNLQATRILTASADSTIHLWDIEGNKIASAKQAAAVFSGVFSPDGNQILTGTEDRYARIWDMKIQNCIDSFLYDADINSATISPDGSKILIAGGDSSARLFDMASHRELGYFKHDDVVKSAIFSKDGKQVLTASWDKTARLWDAATQKQIGPSMKHTHGINSAIFSSDGKWILSLGFDKIRLWNTSTLKEIGMGIGYNDIVTSAALEPGGKQILAATRNFAYIREIAGDLDMPPALFKLQAMAITGVMYDFETNETKNISLAEWYKLKEQYDKEAREHFKNCNYPHYNLWQRSVYKKPVD